MIGLSWADIKNFINQGYGFFEEQLSNPSRYVITIHPRGVEHQCVIFYTDTTDKSDYETNYQSRKSPCICDTYAGQNAIVFDGEALANGVYEDSAVVLCHNNYKNINIENDTDPSTGVDLYYKIWGSPNNSNWEEIQEETLLTKGSKASVVNNDMWKFVKISAKGSGGASEITAYVQVGAH